MPKSSRQAGNFRQQLDAGKPIRALTLDEEHAKVVQSLQLLTAKKVLYIANVDENGAENNPLLDQVNNHAAQEGSPVVAICAAIESELIDLDETEQAEFLASLGQDEPGLNRVIRAGYALLGLQTYFTAGPKESRAWTIPIGATAPQSAGVIHTDFEKGFIRAEVISYNDYIQYDGESGAKEGVNGVSKVKTTSSATVM